MFRILLLTLFLGAPALCQVWSTPDCEEIDCALECPFGFKKNIDGCRLCQCIESPCQLVECEEGKECKVFNLTTTNENVASCVDPTRPEACQQPMDKGTCRAAKSRWFFDSLSGSCQEFMWGGCQGNQNNFEARIDCDMMCNAEDAGFKPGCSPIMCAMHCEFGFVQDDKGCDLCECKPAPEGGIVEKKEFNVEPGCDDEDEAACMMYCEHGFLKDIRGCDVCECAPPQNCPEIQCANECSVGRRIGADGCEQCECRLLGECDPIQCAVECPYGFVKDKEGCPKCQCSDDPCLMKTCPEDYICQSTNISERFEGQCISLNGCSRAMCMMYCEYGFITDTFGCDKCACREQAPPPCPQMKCDAPCEYGNAYDQYKCQGCDCMPDPCLEEKDECTDEEVCEVKQNMGCPNCPARGACTKPHYIKRANVKIAYDHKSEESVDFEKFKTLLKEKLAKLMNVDSDLIENLEVEATDEDSVEVKFHLLKGEEQEMEVPAVVEELKRQLEKSETPINIDGTDFTAKQEPLVAYYSSSAEDEDTVESTGASTSVIVIIACVIGAVVVLVVLVAVVYNIVKAKKASSPSRKNIIYKKPVSDDQMA